MFETIFIDFAKLKNDAFAVKSSIMQCIVVKLRDFINSKLTYSFAAKLHSTKQTTLNRGKL